MNSKAKLILIISSGIGQLISVAILPILGRLYTPEAFGKIGAIIALVSITSVVIHGRYHMVIPVVKGSHMASALLQLALCCSALLCLPVTVLIWFFFGETPEDINIWVFILAGAGLSLFTAVLEIFAYWRSRFLRFNVSAKNSIARSIATSGFQIGLASIGNLGLLVGTIAGTLLAVGLALKDALKHASRPLYRSSFRRMRVAAYRFRAYPIFGVPQGWVAAVSWNALPLLMLKYDGLAMAGQFWVAYRLLVAPLSLLNGAYRQTTLPKMRNISLEYARTLVVKDTIILLLVFGLPLFVIFLAGEWIFTQFMGQNWKVAGAIAGLMAVGILGDVIKIPALCLLQRNNRQRKILTWEMIVVVVRYSIVIPLLIQGKTFEAIAIFSVLGLIGWFSFVIYELFLQKKSIGQ